MSTVRALRSQINLARQELRNAIVSADKQWTQPILEPEHIGAAWSGVTTWTPREAVEHAISGERLFAEFLAHAVDDASVIPLSDFMATLDDWDLDTRRFKTNALGSSADAVGVLADQARRTDAQLAGISDTQLSSPVGLTDYHIDYLTAQGCAAAKTIGGLLSLIACHNRDHARQLARALG
jgi:hypothetical protein